MRLMGYLESWLFNFKRIGYIGALFASLGGLGGFQIQGFGFKVGVVELRWCRILRPT